MDRIKKHYKILSIIAKKNEKEHYLIQANNNGLFNILKIYHDNYNYDLFNRIKLMESTSTPEIIELFEDNFCLYVIEKFINGIPMSNYIENNLLSEKEILSIMFQLLDILHDFHCQLPPIIHRDLTLNNILYDRGKIYIVDFDISRFYDTNKNKDTQILGTKAYIPPEQYGTYMHSTSPASDIYSLGIVFNKLLTGMFPYEFLYQGKYSQIIKKMIRLDPSKRYQSTLEVKKHLLIHSGNIVGFFQFHKKITNNYKFILFHIYIFIIMFCTTIEDVNILGSILYKLFMINLVLIPILVYSNFNGMQSKCYFQKNNSAFVRSLGIIATILNILFIQFIILALLSPFF